MRYKDISAMNTKKFSLGRRPISIVLIVAQEMYTQGIFSRYELDYYLGNPTPLMTVEEATRDEGLRGAFEVATINTPNRNHTQFRAMVDEAVYFGARVIFLDIKHRDINPDNIEYIKKKGYRVIELERPYDYPLLYQMRLFVDSRFYLCVRSPEYERLAPAVNLETYEVRDGAGSQLRGIEDEIRAREVQQELQGSILRPRAISERDTEKHI